MIFTLLINGAFNLLGFLSSMFGGMIGNFNYTIYNILQTLQTIFFSGINFISYFVFWDVIVALLGLTLLLFEFKMAKEIIFRIVARFFIK